MNAESPRLRSTDTTSSDMSAISPGALLVCYLTLTALVLLFGPGATYAAGVVTHLAVLAAVAAATWHRKTPAWLRAWTPILALLFLYSELPMIIRATGHGRFFDATVISWESALFHGQPALAWALRWPSLILSEVLHGAYLSYYGIIVVVPLMLHVQGRAREFNDAMFVLMLTFVACFVCYLALPVQGPRYLWPSRAPAGPVREWTVWLLEARSSRGTAFPSSHVAVATTQSILALRYFGWRGAPVSLLALGLALGAVYGGFHYAIDVVAGAMLAAVVTGFAVLLTTRIRSQANATAPT